MQRSKVRHSLNPNNKSVKGDFYVYMCVAGNHIGADGGLANLQSTSIFKTLKGEQTPLFIFTVQLNRR